MNKKQKFIRNKFTTTLKPEVIEYISKNGGNKFIEALVETYMELTNSQSVSMPHQPKP